MAVSTAAAPVSAFFSVHPASVSITSPGTRANRADRDTSHPSSDRWRLQRSALTLPGGPPTVNHPALLRGIVTVVDVPDDQPLPAGHALPDHDVLPVVVKRRAAGRLRLDVARPGAGLDREVPAHHDV